MRIHLAKTKGILIPWIIAPDMTVCWRSRESLALPMPAARPCETIKGGKAAHASIAIPVIAHWANQPDEFVLGATAALVSVISVSVAEALFEEVLVLARLR